MMCCDILTCEQVGDNKSIQREVEGQPAGVSMWIPFFFKKKRKRKKKSLTFLALAFWTEH